MVSNQNKGGAKAYCFEAERRVLTLALNHLLGRFNYVERGILDVTHKRLFRVIR